jgi:hypothetical protein
MDIKEYFSKLGKKGGAVKSEKKTIANRLKAKAYWEKKNNGRPAKKRSENQKIMYKKYPWLKTYDLIEHRCKTKNNGSYKYYGGKGIKNLLTREDLKTMWFRDKAYSMKRPSIDREDSNKDYVFSNCRYMELSENVSRTFKGRRHKWI